ncbi:hypothetical protein OGCDGJMD_01790 [Cyanobium usitatum str. Tous]|uniref:hypothetical protein n=1 Tax=Cyanobium usitatum TaxID=2304190 RepID=UPI002AD57B0E|nr:hypothetical protein [Cyanobium usitatum]CAK6695207.1 hypothetical protein OGCDGJMD_01790 [Cyanobium usitatum str. Tous]
MAKLWIANTVRDLIQGDVREHLPLERIPLKGDVLGLGTTTSLDNGELTFLHEQGGDTTIWKCQASDGGIRALKPGDGSSHFPYVCFSDDVSGVRTPVPLELLGSSEGRPLQELVGEAIAMLVREGKLLDAPIYGLRLTAEWRSLVITVASKLCMGQQRRNTAIARSETSDATAGQSFTSCCSITGWALQILAILSTQSVFLGARSNGSAVVFLTETLSPAVSPCLRLGPTYTCMDVVPTCAMGGICITSIRTPRWAASCV